MNSASSVLLKGFSILINLLMVPLCLRAVSEKEYGLVLTITAIVNWIVFFDVGIGNGLRNKLSEAIALGQYELGRKYVSTAFYYITLIFSAVLILYSLAHPLIDWYGILNIQPVEVSGLSACIYLVIAVFILRFILQLVCVVLLADQKVYLNDAIMPVSNFLSLGIIFVLYIAGEANFRNLMLSISITPVFVLLVCNFLVFRGKYARLRPSLKLVDHHLRDELLNLGYKFFLLQICGLIIFSTSEFLIARLMGTEDVTIFNIASRYYGIVFLLSNMVMASLWSAFSNAWFQNDIAWISRVIKKMHLANVAFLILNIFLFFGFKPLSHLWLGRELHISNFFAFALIIYNAQMVFNNIFALFLNSIGKLNLQLISGVIGAVINIPMTIFLVRYTNLGLASVCLANIISLLPGSVLTSVQTYRVLKAKGAETHEI